MKRMQNLLYGTIGGLLLSGCASSETAVEAARWRTNPAAELFKTVTKQYGERAIVCNVDLVAERTIPIYASLSNLIDDSPGLQIRVNQEIEGLGRVEKVYEDTDLDGTFDNAELVLNNGDRIDIPRTMYHNDVFWYLARDINSELTKHK